MNEIIPNVILLHSQIRILLIGHKRILPAAYRNRCRDPHPNIRQELLNQLKDWEEGLQESQVYRRPGEHGSQNQIDRAHRYSQVEVTITESAWACAQSSVYSLCCLEFLKLLEVSMGVALIPLGTFSSIGFFVYLGMSVCAYSYCIMLCVSCCVCLMSPGGLFFS